MILNDISCFNSLQRKSASPLNPLILNEYDNDQRREFINTQQRFSTFQAAKARVFASRGSMVWLESKGTQYLARSAYEKSGVRKQRSLGPRSEDTERIKFEFERGRAEAQERLKTITAALDRQAAINRALGLGRMPLIGARILRALEKTGTLGTGLRVVGTNALFAYEAAAGVMVDSSLMTTGDLDFLMDTRGSLRFVVSDEIAERRLLNVLKSVDKSFEKTRREYRAENAQGYMVDLIKPMRNPPWAIDGNQIGSDASDLTASEIAGLVWLENAPSFEAMVLDEKGYPLRLVAVDPRVWAAHKLWVSLQLDRDPLKKKRDEQQAIAVGVLIKTYFPQLPYENDALKMLPRDVFDAAKHLFA